jgi:hypothetical protein
VVGTANYQLLTTNNRATPAVLPSAMKKPGPRGPGLEPAAETAGNTPRSLGDRESEGYGVRLASAGAGDGDRKATG